MPLGLVSTEALLISHSTHSVKLPFFQKAQIVNLVCIRDCREGVYAQDKLNIQANAPSPLLPQTSVQNQVGGGAYFWELVYISYISYIIYIFYVLFGL